MPFQWFQIILDGVPFAVCIATGCVYQLGHRQQSRYSNSCQESSKKRKKSKAKHVAEQNSLKVVSIMMLFYCRVAVFTVCFVSTCKSFTDGSYFSLRRDIISDRQPIRMSEECWGKNTGALGNKPFELLKSVVLLGRAVAGHSWRPIIFTLKVLKVVLYYRKSWTWLLRIRN